MLNQDLPQGIDTIFFVDSSVFSDTLLPALVGGNSHFQYNYAVFFCQESCFPINPRIVVSSLGATEYTIIWGTMAKWIYRRR